MTTDFGTVLARFAGTGAIGPLRMGMEQLEVAFALRGLGLGTRIPGPGQDCSDRYESLDLSMSGGRLVLLGLDHDGELAFTLPASLGGGRQRPSTLSRQAVTALLDQAGCPWAEDPALTFPGGQSAIRTGAGVSLVFARPSEFEVDLPDDAELFASAYLSLQNAVVP